VPFRNLPCNADDVDGASCTEVGGYMLVTRFIGDPSSSLTPVIVLHGGPGHGMMPFKGSLDRLAQEAASVVLRPTWVGALRYEGLAKSPSVFAD
jgi:hypothetical protein